MFPEASRDPLPGAPPGTDAADVLIVGAGPAGSATALALRAAGVPRVVLVDRAAHGSPERAALRVGESATPNVGPLLARLGLPDDLGRLGHRPYHGNLSLWSGDGETAPSRSQRPKPARSRCHPRPLPRRRKSAAVSPSPLHRPGFPW
ncbi:FAD-dependent oxidoreductase [Azospirillum argentinense]|uniref:FAD-dependent oxidoreductase n=1 Tax=Azospirillum argentinense TaxID=2970906 RepID=UPI001FFF1608|nr:FAD-dependent oxidoreductase [Azospirillum argentinense]